MEGVGIGIPNRRLYVSRNFSVGLTRDGMNCWSQSGSPPPLSLEPIKTRFGLRHTPTTFHRLGVDPCFSNDLLIFF